MNDRRISLQLDFEKSRRLGAARLASIKDLERELADARQLLAKESADLAEERTTRAELESQLNEADSAIQDLRDRLRVLEAGKEEEWQRSKQALAQQAQKLRETAGKSRRSAIERSHQFIMAVAREVDISLIPKRLAQRVQRAILARSGLFDAEWYSAYYPDVAASRLDPLDHFVRFGAKEGRFWGAQIASLSQGE